MNGAPIRSGLVLAMALAAALYPAAAQAPASTLDRIVQTGTIRIGYSQDAAPFSYLDTDQSVIGYSIELCGRVAEKLRTQLGMPAIEIALVPRTPSDRVMLLKDGAIDIECVASTNNAERRKSVAFSYPHFVTATQFVTLKSSGRHSLADLSGRTVASTSGTTVIGQLNTLNRDQRLNLAIVPTPDHETGFELMSSGRVSAFVMDGILVATMIANTDDPDLYELSDEALGAPEPYGLMMRHDDIAFQDAVNTALQEIFTQGEIEPLYQKWFDDPIPPHGINLRLPMSNALRTAFETPGAVGD